MNQKQIKAAVEAMLFAAGDPVSADKLAAAVQREIGKTAHLSQHTAGKIAQAQNLRIAAGRVAQSAAQLHFRLMGHMLRHNEKLRPLLAALLYGFQHASRLSGSRPSDPQMQHWLALPRLPA